MKLDTRRTRSFEFVSFDDQRRYKKHNVGRRAVKGKRNQQTMFQNAKICYLKIKIQRTASGPIEANPFKFITLKPSFSHRFVTFSLIFR